MKNNIGGLHGFTDRQLSSVKPCYFHSNFAAYYIVCQRYKHDKPREFLGFALTDCWGQLILLCNHFSGEFSALYMLYIQNIGKYFNSTCLVLDTQTVQNLDCIFQISFSIDTELHFGTFAHSHPSLYLWDDCFLYLGTLLFD